MKVLLVTNQYVDVREDGCWCNFALFGTIENMTVLGELYVVAGKLSPERTPAQPINCKANFLHKKHVFYLMPTNRSIKSYILNTSYNENLLKEVIPTVDLVIGYAPLSAAEIAQKIAKKNQKPFLCFLVACPWDALHNHQRFLARFMAPWRFLRTRKMVSESNYVHYVTSEFLQKRYPTKGKSIGCSDVNLREIDKEFLSIRTNMLIQKKESDEVKLITTAGVDVRYKGQEYVIRALAKLKEERITKYKYYLIGGGEGTYLRNLCVRLGVEDMVCFCGRKTSGEVFNMLRNGDIYIQPSLQEGLPRSVVEAMSFALPCIGFNTGGMPELLSPRYVIRKRDVEGIANALLALDNKDEYLREAQRSYEKAKLFEHAKLQSKIRNFFMEIKSEILNEKNK